MIPAETDTPEGMRLALSLLWVLAVSLSLAAQTPAPPETLRNSRGEELRNPRVLKFDGYKFDVEHAEGITTIPWDKMPASWRTKFNRLEAVEAHGRGLDAEQELPPIEAGISASQA